MTGEDIQDYILTFEDLLMEAGWRRDTVERWTIFATACRPIYTDMFSIGIIPPSLLMNGNQPLE